MVSLGRSFPGSEWLYSISTTQLLIPHSVPVIMICFKVGPALIAGNTLVLKSSEKAPLTSILFARLAKEAGFPPGVLNIVSGFGLPCGDAIARHMDIRKIAFTGSTRTGKLIQKAAVDSNLKSCTLELGYAPGSNLAIPSS